MTILMAVFHVCSCPEYGVSGLFCRVEFLLMPDQQYCCAKGV